MIFALYILPVLALSALAIASRHLYPGLDGKLSSWQYRVAKTLPMIWMLLIYLLWLRAGGSAPELAAADLRFWICVGLIAGLAGDWFLLSRRMFLPGFTAFAAGHVLYLYGCTTVEWVLSPIGIALVFVPGVIYAPLMIRLTQKKKMLPLILFYLVLINCMLLAAVNASLVGEQMLASATPSAATLPPLLSWKVSPGLIPWCLAIGAGLFCISDACWAWNRFVRPMPRVGFWVLSTYYGGQAFIVWGAIQFPPG